MRFLSRQGIPIPVPRVFDYWEADGKANLLIEYIEGKQLLKAWKDLTAEQRIHVMRTLAGYVDVMRAIPQPPAPALAPSGWVGSATGGAFTDGKVTRSMVSLGPFCNQAAFNNWHYSLFAKYEKWSPKVPAYLAELRRATRDDHPIVFTHGDMHMANVLVRVHGEGPEDVEVVALLDWEQSGWRPLYWEAMKWIWMSRGGNLMAPWKEFGWKELCVGYDQDVMREFQLMEVSTTPPDVEDSEKTHGIDDN
ncbi:kinase-like domain-containing protein [Schizophyllum amplum]|uniref:Kinase-like domain-containing protein n=1 Tax=Schizophyllum amplum TaxID=97359 RepID=A0A550CIG7_9AGAR|nr:kinase-like domain-containing protein [Auriculariopsis ampla]